MTSTASTSYDDIQSRMQQKHDEGNEGDQKKHEYRLAQAPKDDQKHSAIRLMDPNTCGIQAR